jgi:hypothetical protein
VVNVLWNHSKEAIENHVPHAEWDKI